MTDDLLRAIPGAVVDEAGLAHVGAPHREQRDLAAGLALAPLGDRTVLAVKGPDRLSWLDSITSQALTGLAAGESTELLVLDPQGHVEHAAGVVDDGERTWLIVDRERAAALPFACQARFESRERAAGRAHRAGRGASCAAARDGFVKADSPLGGACRRVRGRRHSSAPHAGAASATGRRSARGRIVAPCG